MKSVEGNERNDRSREENLKMVALAYLKTMVLLKRAYGISYLLRILKGDDTAFWKTPDPREFETFGSHENHTVDFLRHVLHHLVGFDLVAPRLPDYNVLEITDKGLEWMEKPGDLIVTKASLRFTTPERMLRRKLLEFRKQRANEEFTEPYKIFTDYSLDRLVIEQPDGIAQLAEVPGMSLHRAELYGSAIMSVMKESREDYNKYRHNQLLKRLESDQYQYVRRLVNKNTPVTQIANILGRDESTVVRIARELASEGQVALKQWVEEQVDGTTLHRAMEYFVNTEQPTLKEAFNTLGIDYLTLRLCRVYQEHLMAGEELAASA